MKINTRFHSLPLSQEQLFFVSCWYNMVHEESLDSYRVRVMNPLNILRELLRMTRPPANKEDLSMVAAEALAILTNDPLLDQPHFKHVRDELLVTLRGKKELLESQAHLVTAFGAELEHTISTSYVEVSLARLEEILIRRENIPAIDSQKWSELRTITGNLLSILLDGGASVESLFQLHKHILVREELKKGKPYDFAHRLNLLGKIIKKAPEGHSVIFAIENVPRPNEYPESVGGVEFLKKAPDVEEPSAPILKYLRPHPQKLFAKIAITSADPRNAGALAYTEINKVLDLVRFEYERKPARVLDSFLIAKERSPRHFDIFPIAKSVPNPITSIALADLTAFVKSVDELRSNRHFAGEGSSRVQSAFRLYRVGADTDNFENKLTNWWTALEYLVKGSKSGGGIGTTVETSVVPVLCLRYLHKLLRSFKAILVDLKCVIVDPASQQEIQLQTMDSVQLYTLFKRNDMRPVLMSAAAIDPFLSAALVELLEKLNSTAKTRELIEAHEQRLRWQLQRLWRARCDIVHSADRSVNAALLCANLESYLKMTLGRLLWRVGSVPTLTGPKEFFDREAHEFAQLKAALSAGDESRLKANLGYG